MSADIIHLAHRAALRAESSDGEDDGSLAALIDIAMVSPECSREDGEKWAYVVMRELWMRGYMIVPAELDDAS